MTDDRAPPFRWAVLGTGGVSAKFVRGLAAVPGHAAVACASRRPERAAAFARAFALEACDWEGAAGHPEADAVYVATPPSEHERHARLAIAAGKAVLVEKPFAIDADAAARIADAARAAGVFAMEAMWTRFQPLLAAIRARAGAGDLGELRGFEGRFLAPVRPDPAASLFDPLRGGGALMHRGVYALSLARHLLGPVDELSAVARIGATGVDEDCVLALRHASGAVSSLRAGLRSPGANGAELYGTDATIRIAAPIFRPGAARLIAARPRAGGTGGGGRLAGVRESGLAQAIAQRLGPWRAALMPPGRALRAPYAGNGYGHQAAAVAAAVRAGETECALMPLAESVEIMGLIDRARAAWGHGEGRP